MRVKEFKSWLILYGIMLGLTACSKDKTNCNCCSWSETPKTYEFTEPRFSYNYPFFNPQNSDEFIYVKGDANLQTATFIIAHLSSGQQYEIFTTSWITGLPRWGPNNWLAFSQYGNIYKIKSTGDSLTQITFSGNRHNPCWNFDGSKIIYEVNYGTSGIEIIDKNGLFIKQINGPSSFGKAWNENNGIIANFSESQISLINDITYSISTIDSAPRVNSCGVCWLDSVNLVYVADNNIFKINTNTNERSVIKRGCDIKVYVTVSVSQDKTKIISEVLEYYINESKTKDPHFVIVVMNIDGTNERPIYLP